ncbi:MAG TPA: response regulator [Bryobacteraceae bacterium]|jgi:DNA-binding response OmpR family regulator|nr:response regulator [Bryobacteraceae bacterium]
MATVRPTVLVVEDDDALRRFIRRTLTEAGYDVIEASGGLEARQVALGRGVPIGLAVLDIVMAAGSGLDFANELLLERPSTPILYISGFADSLAVESIQRRTPDSILLKPFTASAFLDRVQRLMPSAAKNGEGA